MIEKCTKYDWCTCTKECCPSHANYQKQKVKLEFDGTMDELIEDLKGYVNFTLERDSDNIKAYLDYTFTLEDKPKPIELETILYFDGSGLDVPGTFLEIAQLLQHMTRKERTLGFVMELLHSQFKVKERIKDKATESVELETILTCEGAISLHDLAKNIYFITQNSADVSTIMEFLCNQFDIKVKRKEDK